MQQQELVAGDSLNFPTSGGAYPASSGWVLSYLLVPRVSTGPGVPPNITFEATADGSDFDVAIAATTTANWTAGDYTWYRRVNRGGEKYTVGEGQLTIKPNPESLAAGYDGRSQAEKALDEAQAAYSTYTTSRGTTRRYRIGDREMEFSSSTDIVKLINYWKLEVKRERRRKALAEGRPDPNRTYVRLNRE